MNGVIGYYMYIQAGSHLFNQYTQEDNKNAKICWAISWQMSDNFCFLLITLRFL
jgi:hypothetical protein